MVAERKDLHEALIAFAAVAVGVALFVRLLDFQVPLIGHVGSALVAVLLLYAPVFAAWRRGEDIADYGFHAAPVGRGLATAAVAVLVLFPLFAVAYLTFYQVVCHSPDLHRFAVPGVCGRFLGWDRPRLPHLDGGFGEQVLVQLVVVALPEELFFRGYLLRLLERALPPRRRILGGGVGWALVISAALFALIHLPKEGDPRALATFFPGLLFGWMRSATGSILASTVTHASSNLFVIVLEKIYLR
ncbi:MAG TPA: CPBP family intramembrane glutamic endopeptidase [Kofleriaceae bacterium]|nr:CPBP family intramembrane glutamic endopeptidase [Kofleriaceae bacterium]